MAYMYCFIPNNVVADIRIVANVMMSLIMILAQNNP
jgi:hypothetical protein